MTRKRHISIILAVAVFTAVFTVWGVADVSAGRGHKLKDPIWTESGYVAGTLMDLQTYSAESVHTQTGMDLGDITVGELGNEIRIYLGIPYAAPPVGDLRWKPPQPVTPWDGIRQTATLGKWATQAYPTGVRYGYIQESGMSEDCLYLNVLTPAKRNTDRLPVMVWFHGGGLWGQSGHRDIYNSPGLAQHGVVHVTVSHRLNVMGYMAHPALSAESPRGTSGNYGMLDLVAALKWVRNNIAAFGGDPGRVTIFGQSGGGNKVQWLMTSPLSKGLFHGAISQSGYGSLTRIADAEQNGVDFAAALANGCVDDDISYPPIMESHAPGSSDELAAMRALPWQDLVDQANYCGFYRINPTADGWSTLDYGSYWELFQAGMQHDVPFIIGMTQNDIGPVSSGTVNLVANATPRSSPMWVYEFTYIPTNWKQPGVEAWHSLENGYVFGNWPFVPLINYASYGVRAGLTDPDPGFDERDPWMSEWLMQTWIRFAKTGDPNPRCSKRSWRRPKRFKKDGSYRFEGQSVPKWLPHTAESDLFLQIDYPPVLHSGFPLP
jgi:para-nitrobenzyl esterase